jgi:O-methyltransferase
MHLYDSWGVMKKEYLFENESSCAGLHENLDIETTKRNLNEFKNNVIYHKGYIPDSFDSTDTHTNIIYLHIDLNSAKSTLETLDFFYPKIARGGVILFDDYGHKGFESTKKVVDKFFSDKPGIHLKFPTGQSIFFSNS